MTAPLSTNKIRWVLVACWLLWCGLHFLLLTSFGYTNNIAATDALVNNVLLALGCIVVNNVFKYYLPQKEKIINVLAVCAALTFAVVFINRIILYKIFATDTVYSVFLSNSMPVRAGIAVLMLGWMALLCILWYSMENQQQKLQRINETEQLAKDAELLKLRQQLQPHFLFNSLNSINALIGSQPQQARIMIEQLSDFLRGTIKKESQQWNSLAEELDYLQLYLDIEKVRFGHRLNTQIICDEVAKILLLPPLLLQPLVENAIKFGLYDTVGEVLIKINAIAVDNYLQVTIENPFDSTTAVPKTGTGFGLSSVKRRLYLLFARNDLFVTHTTENIFTTTIKIPQPHAESNIN